MLSSLTRARFPVNCARMLYATKATHLGPLHDDLVVVLEELRKERHFRPEHWLPAKVDLLNNYMTKNSLSACVVNVSGGIDSAVTISIINEAKKHPNTPIKKIVGVSQPIHSTKESLDRARRHCHELGVEYISVDQSDLHKELQSKVEAEMGYAAEDFASGQLRSYMRTPVAYFVAQMLTQRKLPAIVVGTGNYDEDGYLLYYCKAGDGIADVQLISELHKSEVYTIAKRLGVPKEIAGAAPSADLWSGQTDEEELGFGYDAVELYTQWVDKDRTWKAQKLAGLSSAAQEQLTKLGEAIETIHQRNLHKRSFPVNLEYPFFHK